MIKTLDPTKDPIACERFERNIVAVERHSRDLAAQLRAIDSPASKVVEVGDDLNIDIGHTLFYETGVRQFVDDQYSAYTENPYRIDIGWPVRDNLPPQLMTKMAIKRLTFGAKALGIEPQANDGQQGITGFAVSLGVGIGDHIGRMLNDFEAQSLIVVEQFIEFLWYSLYLNPWDEWIELVESRKGQVFFILDDNAVSVSSELTVALRSDNGGTLDGALVYTHYRSPLVREIHKGLSDQISYIGSNRGFFEDENIMIMNSTRNFLSRDYAIWRTRPRHEKRCPAFVVAAGPSVDMAMDTIRKFKDQVVLISCGSGLKVLLSQGIKPDFHVEVENTYGQADILERIASQYDLSGITFVGAATVNPRTAAVFDKVIFFHRDTVCSSRFYELNEDPMYLAVPTVSNGGARFALGAAFKEVYLFGVDLGSRIADYHHSKASAYYTDKEFMFSFQGTKESTEMALTIDGNFGGTVVTNDGFLLSRLFMQKLMKMFSGYKVYNCSDGVEIPGAVPKLPQTIKLTSSPKDRETDLKRVDQEMQKYAKGEGVPLDRFYDLRQKTITWYQEIYAAIKEMKKETKPNPFESYGIIWALFQPKEGEVFDPIVAVVWQNNYGTLMTMFNVYFRMHRRVTDEEAPAIYQLFLDELLGFLEDMESILMGVLDELIAEVEAVEAEKVKSA
ncbi:MAG: DUF115 domain-containing protein [Alphaproteobacteria bacterium]|nr:DUF115 domain-containing protein [Alphaproteobacteria bacterium]